MKSIYNLLTIKLKTETTGKIGSVGRIQRCVCRYVKNAKFWYSNSLDYSLVPSSLVDLPIPVRGVLNSPTMVQFINFLLLTVLVLYILMLACPL